MAVLRAAVGVALVAWLLSRLDLHGLADAFGRARAGYVALGIAMYFMQPVVMAIRLYVLVRHVIERLAPVVRLVLISTFFNSFLPSNIGGDGYKVVYLKRRGRGWTDALAYVVYDRVVGLGAITAGLAGYLAICGIPAGQTLAWRVPRWAWSAAIALGGVAAVALVLRRRAVTGRVRQTIGAVRAALGETPWRAHAGVVALAFVNVGVQVARFMLFACALDAHVPAAGWLYVIGLASILGIAPVSVGGLGVQEGVIVFALAAFGVPPATAAAIAFLNRVAIWLCGLAGGLLFLVERGAGEAPAQRA